MKKVLVVILFLYAGNILAEASSCKRSTVQQQAKTAERYTIKKVNTLLSNCGIGNLLNFGLGNSLSVLTKNINPSVCNVPIAGLQNIPVPVDIRVGKTRKRNLGNKRPLNVRIKRSRTTYLKDGWYPFDDQL